MEMQAASTTSSRQSSARDSQIRIRKIGPQSSKKPTANLLQQSRMQTTAQKLTDLGSAEF